RLFASLTNQSVLPRCEPTRATHSTFRRLASDALCVRDRAANLQRVNTVMATCSRAHPRAASMKSRVTYADLPPHEVRCRTLEFGRNICGCVVVYARRRCAGGGAGAGNHWAGLIKDGSWLEVDDGCRRRNDLRDIGRRGIT